MSGSFDRVMEERKKLVEQIIENMEKGYVLPKPQWKTNSLSFHNPISGVKYRGANLIKLYMSSILNGYTDTRYMTWKQANSKNYKIKKGEKGIRLEKFIFTKKVEQENKDTGEIEKVEVKLERPMVNTFVVFNAEQIDEIEPMEELPTLEYDEVLKIADRLILSSECPIIEKNQPESYYSPSDDKIILPPRNAFFDQEAFTTTLIHEMVHSTGHKDRLNRQIMNTFGTPDYAVEELRAELGAFFMGTDLGIEQKEETFNSHTDYLKSWISVLKEDPNELFRASSDAQKAVDYIRKNYDKELEREMQATEEAIEKDLAENIDIEFELV